MPKYLLLYRGDVLPPADLPVAENEVLMEQWGVWMDKHGDQVSDPGLPFGARGAVGGAGGERAVSPLTGYTIVKADSLEAACELCSDHPFLQYAGGDCAVEIFELVPI
ncbi:MAG TPA: hypothetical protein VLI04_10535 [Nocardioidaceae bacterium]|nr:hypothetical protein [Nocardioidaceae bacterium]